MSLYEWLLKSRTKEELAKELASTAKENATLRDQVGRLEHELFWMKVEQRHQQEGK